MAWVIHYELLTCFTNLLATFPFDSLHKGFFTLKCFYSQIWLQTPPHKSCTDGGKTQIAVGMRKTIYGGKLHCINTRVGSTSHAKTWISFTQNRTQTNNREITPENDTWVSSTSV